MKAKADRSTATSTRTAVVAMHTKMHSQHLSMLLPTITLNGPVRSKD